MALPTFVAAGAMSNSATVDITPALPTGHTTGDILLLFVETVNTVVPATPAGYERVLGLPISGAGSTLSIFWKRDGGSEVAPTVTFVSDHHSAHIEAYRGCIATGTPYSITYPQIKNTPSTTMTAQGSFAPVADCLVLVAAAQGEDVGTARASSPTNADLANVTERFDGFTTDGNGGGIAVVTGEKATAGDFGATTWTWVASVADVCSVIVLLPAGANRVLPYIVGVGTFASSATVDITPGLPTGWAENDILIIVCETPAAAPATPSGYTVFPDSPQTTLTGNDSTLSVFWKRATSSESAPTVALGGLNHVSATIFAVRNCVTTGSPWDVTSGGANDTADGTFSATGDTSTVGNTMVVVFGANGTDDANPQFGGFTGYWTNATTPLVEVLDNFTTIGHGGGHAAAVGWQRAAGAYGNTTVALQSSAADVWMTGNLKPVIILAATSRSQAVIIG